MTKNQSSQQHIVTCDSEEETVCLAESLARQILPGMVVCLDGPLGAGKTRFVRAFAAALGVPEDQVNSPTYVILQHYPGKFPLHHFDMYRLQDEDEWYELGAEELIDGDGVCLVEWSNRFPQLFPEDRIFVVVEPVGEHARKFLISSGTGESRETVARWLSSC